MMTSREIQTLIDNILLQVNQAFGTKDDEIKALKERLDVLESKAAPKKAPAKKAA